MHLKHTPTVTFMYIMLVNLVLASETTPVQGKKEVCWYRWCTAPPEPTVETVLSPRLMACWEPGCSGRVMAKHSYCSSCFQDMWVANQDCTKHKNVPEPRYIRRPMQLQ
ncbi:hypothetical protein PGT21_025747 [Puccinia graminis f. sp. tritici]|uniref:Uncharacterized protein n=1 Tax=Puccinia graminis f. sp. tritici TaxID=56615 RepID=A0A5B0QY62_PUCGR|nr:hypothetical protein PGT21_025747 [Puccinia graminis f. sp. tritici]